MRIVTFGEIMLRLKSPALERLFQSPQLEATFGGGEANVAVSLANYGEDAAFVTILPDTDIGRAALRELRGLGVDTNSIRFKPGRLGVYYLETGAMQRPSKVIYDRADSCVSLAGPGDIDWAGVFSGAGWFHITGITPAISPTCAGLSLEAVKTAAEMGLHVSCDLNYRKNLWKYGKAPHEVMGGLVRYIDTVIANEEDIQKALGIGADHQVKGGHLDPAAYKALAVAVKKAYPNVSRVAITLRSSHSADHNTWAACLYNGKDFFLSREYEMNDIVDRVGGGDSFSGGLIYGLTHYPDEEALNFAVAASCLKHSISGDYNRVSLSEVKALMGGSGSGRVER